MKFSGVTILQGVKFSIFPIDFEWASQQCSATALPVISLLVRENNSCRHDIVSGKKEVKPGQQTVACVFPKPKRPDVTKLPGVLRCLQQFAVVTAVERLWSACRKWSIYTSPASRTKSLQFLSLRWVFAFCPTYKVNLCRCKYHRITQTINLLP